GHVSLALNNCTIANNRARNEGGGVFVGSADQGVTITGCTFVGNTADLAGGGLFNHSRNANLAVYPSTLSGNTAQSGAGLFPGHSIESPPGAPGPALLDYVTIFGNIATSAGGGLAGNSTGQILLTNTLIAGNAGRNSATQVLPPNAPPTVLI